jgi:hypothetical protein
LNCNRLGFSATFNRVIDVEEVRAAPRGSTIRGSGVISTFEISVPFVIGLAVRGKFNAGEDVSKRA